MSTSLQVWISFGLNMLLSSRRIGFAIVPARYAVAVQEAAADELGIRTVVSIDRKHDQRKIQRVGE